MHIIIKKCNCRGIESYTSDKSGKVYNTLLVTEGKSDIRIRLGEFIIDGLGEDMFISIEGDVKVTGDYRGNQLEFSSSPTIKIL